MGKTVGGHPKPFSVKVFAAILSSRLFLFALAIFLAIAVSQVLAWTAPTQSPPSGGGGLKAEQNAPASSIYVKSNGDVGIGTSTPGQKLTVAGMIESTIGGFKFPDGSTQTTNAAPFFSVSSSVNQTIANQVTTKINWDTEASDTNNNFASNGFTPTVAGKYLLTAELEMLITGGNQAFLYIYKNGGLDRQVTMDINSSAGRAGIHTAVIIDANGSSDYFEVYFHQNTGNNMTIEGGAQKTWFSGIKIN